MSQLPGDESDDYEGSIRLSAAHWKQARRSWRYASNTLEVDHRAGDFWGVQLTPPGSACSIVLMPGPAAPGSTQGLRLVVSDIDAARADLLARGLECSEIFHFDAGHQTPGPHPQRA